MAVVETAVGAVVALFLSLLTVAMAYLTWLSLRDEVHSPRPPVEEPDDLSVQKPS